MKYVSFDNHAIENVPLILSAHCSKIVFMKALYLAGILPPVAEAEMDISLNEKKISLSELKKEVTYIPSKPYLFDYLSGYDNIKYLVSLFELQEQYEKIMRNIEDMCLLEDLDMEVHTYSLGMKAKLYLAVMLERKTSVIIIDELLNNIDTESLAKIIKILKNKMDKEKSSIIFSSHTQMIEMGCNIKKIYLRNERIEII